MLALGLPMAAQAAPSQPRALAHAAPACADGDLAPDGESLERVGEATLCLINAERARRGRRPLRSNAKLARAALRHARDMVAHSYFAHVSRDGSEFGDRIRAAGYLDGARDWHI